MAKTAKTLQGSQRQAQKRREAAEVDQFRHQADSEMGRLQLRQEAMSGADPRALAEKSLEMDARDTDYRLHSAERALSEKREERAAKERQRRFKQRRNVRRG